MSLPFGLPSIKEYTIRKKGDSAEAAASYEQQLMQYRETLENYKKCILEYSGRLDNYDKRSVDNQLSIVQTALDMTYLKEQGDKTEDQLQNLTKQVQELDNRLEERNTDAVSKTLLRLESLSSAVAETNDKFEGLDKNVVNRLSELLLELQKQNLYLIKQSQTELMSSMEKLTKTVKKGNSFLWFLFILNILGLGALALLVLYVLEIIPF